MTQLSIPENTREQHNELYWKVVDLLRENESYRNSDRKLIARIWRDECASKFKMNAKSVTAESFLFLFGDGKLSNSDSITRLKRLAQHKFPELKGTGSKSIKKHQVRQQLRDLGSASEGHGLAGSY